MQHIQYTAGIYGFFASVAQAVRKEAGHDLCKWETGMVCKKHYRMYERWYNPRSDALAEYRVGLLQMRFWLEWDCGTMNARDLAIKFISYEYYIASRQWAREDSRLVFLVCVAPDIAQERQIQRVAQATLAPALGLVVWATTEELLNQYGSLAPIWLQSLAKHSKMPQNGEAYRHSWTKVLS